MKLIVNADDFGYSRGVNYGIITAHQYGIVTSASMMVNMPGAEHAFALMKENPRLGVGVHLTLTCGSPLRDDVPSLVDSQGKFHSLEEIFRHADPEEIERELSSQIEAFLATGFTPTHLDSHHHVHGHPLVQSIVIRLAERYRLPLRKFQREKTDRVRTTDHFIYQFYGDHLSVELFLQLIGEAEQETDGIVEFMCHPAFVDEELLAGSSYALQRAKELKILTAPELVAALTARKIELISYAGL